MWPVLKYDLTETNFLNSLEFIFLFINYKKVCNNYYACKKNCLGIRVDLYSLKLKPNKKKCSYAFLKMKR